MTYFTAHIRETLFHRGKGNSRITNYVGETQMHRRMDFLWLTIISVSTKAYISETGKNLSTVA